MRPFFFTFSSKNLKLFKLCYSDSLREALLFVCSTLSSRFSILPTLNFQWSTVLLYWCFAHGHFPDGCRFPRSLMSAAEPNTRRNGATRAKQHPVLSISAAVRQSKPCVSLWGKCKQNRVFCSQKSQQCLSVVTLSESHSLESHREERVKTRCRCMNLSWCCLHCTLLYCSLWCWC